MHYDVFTSRAFAGNQLAVYLDGRGLSADAMQAIAKEMNFSETTFVLPPEAKGTDTRMRIFTPGSELPMAGHPVIGSTFALARAGVIEAGRERFTFGLGVGPLPVSLQWKGSELRFVWMTQLKPTFDDPIANPARAAAALSLPPKAVTAGQPVQVVSCGVPFLFVPLATRRAVDRAVFDRTEYAALVDSLATRPNGVFVFSAEQFGARGHRIGQHSGRATVYSRMFAPDLGVAEDPATGSASGPLGCYLVRHRIVTNETAGAMLSLQGVKMGRPSEIHISIGLRGGEISSVQVGGESVLAGEGTLYV